MFGGVFFHKDYDRVEVLVSFKGGVNTVGELQLESVFPGWQRQFNFKRAVAEMQMLLVGWNNLAGWDEISIDENVHVP